MFFGDIERRDHEQRNTLNRMLEDFYLNCRQSLRIVWFFGNFSLRNIFPLMTEVLH